MRPVFYNLDQFDQIFSPVCIICISNLPKEKDKNFYEKYLKDFITDLDSDDVESESGKRRQGHLGPIYPKYGSVFLSFWSKKAAFLSFRLLQEEMPNLRLNILPNINSKTEFYEISLIFFHSTNDTGRMFSITHICKCKIWWWSRQKSLGRFVDNLFFPL